MDDQISDSSDEYTPDVNNESLIVNGLFGIADEENNVENTTAQEFTNDINMEAEAVVETIINKLCNESDQHVIKTIEENNHNNSDCVQTAESNCFGSRMICSESADLDHSELPCSFASISKNYEKSKSTVVLSKGNLPSTLTLISTDYQDSSSDDSDTSDEDDSNDDDQFINSDDENSIISVSSIRFSKESVKTKGELDISDLPPIEDLKISVDEDKCQPVGCIKSVVDTLVVVEAFLNQPALDIDSVLFVDRGKRALGRIFDVFGPVIKPFYAVRFNDSDHIKKFDIQIKEPVYCAPQTEYASYVMVSQLMQQKGSDASWKDNNEPPKEFLDYSDDEEEKLAKKRRRQKKWKKRSEDDDTIKKEKSPDPPSQRVVRNNPTPRSMTPRSMTPRSMTPRSMTPRSMTPRSMTPHPSYQNSNNQTHQTYNPHPPIYGNHDHNGPGQFPTYAQHLSSMDYSLTPGSMTPNPSYQNSNNQTQQTYNTYPSYQNSNDQTQQTYNTYPSYQNSNDQTQQTYNPYPSYQNSNDQTQQTYNPHPPIHGNHDQNGPRQFPTYAQHLSSMDYSQAYHQPYNPWYYDQTQPPPRH